MNWPDVFAVIVVLAAALFGLRKGFWAELLSILGVGLAIISSAWLAPKLAVLVPGWGTLFARGVTVLLFVISLGVFYALYRWITGRARDWVPDALSPLNRIGGVLVGAAKGLALAGLMFFVVIQPHAPSSWYPGAREAHLAPLALSMDVLALEALGGPVPAFRPFSRFLGAPLLRFQNAPGVPAVVMRKVAGQHPDA